MSFSRSAADPADTLPDLAATLGEPPLALSRSATRFIRGCRPRACAYVVGFSDEVAQLLDLPPSIAAQPGFAELFAGNPTRDWPAHAMPYAAVYSGHQFGVGPASSATAAR